MKIALVDNMNNNLFVLMRYLRDLGHITSLYLVDPDGPNAFSPEEDTFEKLSDFSMYTLPDLCNMKNWLKSKGGLIYRKYFKSLRENDIIVACGPALAYLNYFNISVDLVVPYGSDLYTLTRKNRFNSWFKNLIWNNFSSHQVQAIKHCKKIVGMNNNILVKEIYAKYVDSNHYRLPIPLVYEQQFPQTNDSCWGFLDKHDFIVFNHSRQYWKSNIDNHKDFHLYGGDKRNDKLIRAFARFVKHHYFKSPVLVLFDYGPDVGASKQLIEEQGISDYVVWMPKMKRKHILQGLTKADFGYDQCRENVAGIGGVAVEVLACGVPLITHTSGETTDKTSPFYQAPLYDLLQEQEIYQLFLDYAKNPQPYRHQKTKIRAWFSEKLGLGLAKQYEALLKQISEKSVI